VNDKSDDRPADDEFATPKYWYTSIAFVGAVIGSTLYVAALISLGSSTALQGGIVVLWLGGLSALGALTYLVLLKDTAKVRKMGFTWQPKSWYYVLVGFSTPLVALLFFGQRYPPAVSELLSLIIFILITSGINAFYLYRRHQFLGTP